MRAVTIAAAGAALWGSVSAASHRHMHARLHVRDEAWGDWNTTAPPPSTAEWSSSAGPASPTTTEAAVSESWEDWATASVDDPATTTTSTESWGDWPATSADPAATTTSTEAWGDWESTSTTTLFSTVTTTKYVEWATTSTAVSTGWSVDPGVCVISIITSYGHPTCKCPCL